MLLITYVSVASLIAFFTVKIIGVPIGRKMTTKIVLSILAFTPVYVLLAYLLSRLVSGEIRKLSDSTDRLPFSVDIEGSFISEIDDLAEVIRNQASRILDILEAQRFLLLRLAHDLRTPVSNLRNVLQGIKEGVIPETERPDYIDRLIEETYKMEELLESVLADIRKSVKRTEPESVDISELVKKVAQMWRLRFSQKGICFELELEEDVKGFLSPADLEEVLNNLLENAYKNTPEGKVCILLKRNGRYVSLRIENTGAGLEEGKIMQAYREGRLGLYITRELVWRNGGSLKVSKEKGNTVFTIRFPLP